MKVKRLIRKIIVSSWFLAGIPAVIVIMLLPSIGSKYKLISGPLPRNSGRNILADLNGDSIPEIMQYGRGNPYYFITVKNSDNLLYDQWNLKDSISPGISGIFTGNYDHDKFGEIYIFTNRGDSLFLNVNEMLQPYGTRLDRVFITKIGFLNGEVSAVLKPAGFFDTDGDGKDELYFSISSGFQLGPRKLYSFDIARRHLASSGYSGSILLNPMMADIDGDGRPEIFGTMSSSGNYRRNVPYTDSSTWLMVFDDRLNFKFPPVEFRGFANGLNTLPYHSGDFSGFAVMHLANGADTSVLKSRIMIFTATGKLVRSRLLNSFTKSHLLQMFVERSSPDDRIYILADRFYELNAHLETERAISLPFVTPFTAFRADVDGDGSDEYLLYSAEEKKLVVYSADIHMLTWTSFTAEDEDLKFYPFPTPEHQYRLFVGTGRSASLFTLRKNRIYYPEYLLYPSIYLAFFFFIMLIKRIGTSQQKARESLNNRLITLQLQGIKAQLDPHFTFNTLNSIASLIYLEDRQAAYDYMRKFTQLLRCMLNDADKIYRNLGDEIEFVTTYLDLEKLRFGDKFDYEIEIHEGISQLEQVPKLVLQTFAENAVKHGIMPSESGGLIRITIRKEKEYLKLTVEDNGVGRVSSAGHSTSTGIGLKLTGEFYEILNQINRKPIKHLITDLYDDSRKAMGTRVEVWVPAEEFNVHLKA